jgi:hypothetical protein
MKGTDHEGLPLFLPREHRPQAPALHRALLQLMQQQANYVSLFWQALLT